MLRLIVGDHGEFKIDRLGNGRGGYLHRLEECWKLFLRRKNLRRAFHMEIGRTAKEKLIQELWERHWE